MPAYEYPCRDCKHDFIVFLAIKEFASNPKIKCPQCGTDNVQKKFQNLLRRRAKSYSYGW